MNDLLPTLGALLVWTWVVSRIVRRYGPAERALLWVSFAAHQLAAIVNIWITAYYYGYGDMMTYYNFGLLAAERLRTDFWALAPNLVSVIFHRQIPLPIPVEILATSSGSMQAIAGFAMYFSFDSLYATCAVISALALLSKIALYDIACEELPHIPRRALLVACTLLPSMLFWSCSLLKEPLAMIGVLGSLYGWHQLINGRRRARAVVLLLLGGALMFALKAYLIPALGLAAAIWYFARKVHDRRGDITFKAGHVAVGVAIGGVLVLATGALLPQFAPEILSDQLAGLQAAGSVIEGGSNYTLGRGAGSPSSQAILAPFGLITALFRPFILEVKSPIVLVSALEMTLFFGATILVFFRRGVVASCSELVRRPFLSFCAMFVMVFGTCVGLGTTNLGTLSRYRMPLTPFFASLLVALLAKAPSRVAIDRPILRVDARHN